MQCRECGTEIADKALICFKCGAATTLPTFRPPAPGGARPRRGLVATLAALVLLALAAAFLARTSSAGASRSVTWIIAGVAIVIVVLRAYARRRS